MAFSAPRYTLPIPAIQGWFGDKIATYATQVPPDALEDMIGHDPRSAGWKSLQGDIREVYDHLQRKTAKARIEGLVRYFEHRFGRNPVVAGALPSISIACQKWAEFTPFSEVGQQGVGELHFNLGSQNRRIVVDGLARVTAALAIRDTAMSDPDKVRREENERLLSRFVLPCILYLPKNEGEELAVEDLQQLFHDFNFKAEPIKAKDAIALDHSDIYIGLANRLGRASVIVENGGMEKKAASLGKKSTALAVQMNILRFVRAATEGPSFLEATTRSEPDNPHLAYETLEATEHEIVGFLEAFAEEMGEQFTNHDAIHLSAPGWGTLGVVYHDLRYRLNVPDIQATARAIGRLDWAKEGPLWASIVDTRKDREGNIVTKEDGTPALTLVAGGGSRNRRAVTNIVRDAIGINQHLVDAGFAEEVEASKVAAQ